MSNFISRRTAITVVWALLWTILPPATPAEEPATNAQAMIDYKVTPKVTYGRGQITIDGQTRSRDLWTDVYEPVGPAQEARPAVIMTFGGSFHRGGPRMTFEVDGAQDTSMGDYCRRFAQRGYVCFAIDYRLAPENPVPVMSGYSEADLDMESLAFISPRLT